ncbi:MAG: AAA family ATPase [Syntrophomonadaceae bacterium]|nr:AAA family ATPase [Syntrophomonadaceae bacterium]MDD3023864.1 AAA family ATPase [Syntrophomonadaceae bacterium]
MKEIVVGSVVALVIFLAVIGINVTPLVFIGIIIGGFYFFIQTQGNMKLEDVGNGLKNNLLLSFDDIGGQDTAINELKEALEFIRKPEEIIKMGIRPLKGILLVGPPGTGKTLLARAAASYTDSVFIAASGSEFIEIYAGVGAKRIRQIFSDARKKAQKINKSSAILFIDELDVLGAKRGSNSSHMEYDQTLNQLLVEMDGLTQNKDPRMLIIGATNRVDLLDPALIRPGRFDRQVQVGLPDKKGRVKILDIHTRNKPLSNDFMLEDIGRETFGFSGAHLESLANEAAILALRENSATIDKNHFLEAVNKVIMGEKLDRRPNNDEMRRVAYHESGHALVSEYVNPGSVSSLTVIPRGMALGFMRQSPADDQYLYTRAELEKQIIVALAGAVAEELALGNRSTGSKNDFAQAWKLSREIVGDGLSSLGIVDVEKLSREIFYEECKSIISDLENKTRSVLQDRQDCLRTLAEYLITEESIDREQFIEFIP